MLAWKSFRYRLEERACRWLAAALPRLSRRACVRLANVLGTLAYALDRRGRAVALTNLACAFGERYSAAERRALARASYRNFVRTMLDLFWAKNLNAENWSRWMQVEGAEELRQRLAREQRGAVLMCVHQGNWEWASLACGFLGFPTTIVAENFKNPRLTAIFAERREHSGHRIIPQESAILRLLKIAKRGGTTGMLIDLNLRPSQSATVLEAFGPGGLKMCVPLLHAVLARRVGALLVPVETEPRADGTCRIVVHPALEIPAHATEQQIAQACWNFFEPILRARPESWLWPYKHFRYRPRAAVREYPPYANPSAKFDKLLRSVNAV